MNFKGKKVLLIGLGILGGGVSVSNWLLKQGAKLTIFDEKPESFLKDSKRQIKGKGKFIFGHCPESVIRNTDLVVINQAVPLSNPIVRMAEALDKPVYNESNIFYESCDKPVIAITGTRGKTTTANWTAHILGTQAVLAGNSTNEPLLKMLPKTKSATCKIVVNEIPSFQLERFEHHPQISVITNIYVDHLNRHGTLENYALVKGNVFKHQTKDDKLILNYDNDWTEFYLALKPKAQVWFFTLDELPKNKNGICYADDTLYLHLKGKHKKIADVKKFVEFWGMHNLANLEAAILAAYLAGEKIPDIKAKIQTLPQVKFRQERVHNGKNMEVINDTAATSPEGGIAAVERFGGKKCVLITGGTDAGLEYGKWAKIVSKHIPAERIILLAGSASKKMFEEFRKHLNISKIKTFNTLDECFAMALEISERSPKDGKTIILFSPSAKSFEKFKNEFDRGEKFNEVAKKYLRKNK